LRENDAPDEKMLQKCPPLNSVADTPRGISTASPTSHAMLQHSPHVADMSCDMAATSWPLFTELEHFLRDVREMSATFLRHSGLRVS
jgi:hypothetical protein